MTSFEVYKLYVGLKTHFLQPSYNFIEKKGIIRCGTTRSFDKRKDIYYFTKIRDKFTTREKITWLFIYNFLHNPELWIGNFLSEDAYEIFLSHQKINFSFLYYFKQDLEILSKEKKIENDNRPILIRCAQQNIISIETFIALRYTYNLYNNKNMDITINDFLYRCSKYETFLNINKEFIKNTVKNLIALE